MIHQKATNQKASTLQFLDRGRRLMYKIYLILIDQPKRENVKNMVAVKDATKDTTVICVLMEGPAVSLNGSPTVSPITPAL